MHSCCTDGKYWHYNWRAQTMISGSGWMVNKSSVVCRTMGPEDAWWWSHGALADKPNQQQHSQLCSDKKTKQKQSIMLSHSYDEDISCRVVCGCVLSILSFRLIWQVERDLNEVMWSMGRLQRPLRHLHICSLLKNKKTWACNEVSMTTTLFIKLECSYKCSRGLIEESQWALQTLGRAQVCFLSDNNNTCSRINRNFCMPLCIRSLLISIVSSIIYWFTVDKSWY